MCADCRTQCETVTVDAATIALAQELLASTFQDIRGFQPDQPGAFSVLSLAQQWMREHAGCSLKSLNFLFTCGLF